MSTVRIAAAGIGLLLSALPMSATSEPTRKIVALGHDGADPKSVADRIVDVARRCWIPQMPEFTGLKIGKIEPGAEPNLYRVIFAEAQNTKTKPRHLRVLVGNKTSATIFVSTIIVAEEEGIDVSEIIGRDARAILKGRPTSC